MLFLKLSWHIGVRERILNIGKFWICKFTDHSVGASGKSTILVGGEQKAEAASKPAPDAQSLS